MHGQRAAARCIGSEREYGSREKPWAELEDGLQGKHRELSEHHGHALQMDRWQGSLGSLPGVLAHTLFHSFHIWQQHYHRPSTGGRVSEFGSGEFPNLAAALQQAGTGGRVPCLAPAFPQKFPAVFPCLPWSIHLPQDLLGCTVKCTGSEREYGCREKPWAELEDGLQGKHR